MSLQTVAADMCPVEAGAMVGVLGGGQLGAMFATAAKRLGYRVAVWDPDPDAPALALADRPVGAPFTDLAARATFAKSLRVITYEWENVPAELTADLARQVPVRPAPDILRIVQDRVAQKEFLSSQGIPVAPFQAVLSPDALAVPRAVGFPCLCKTARSGYDGKGQWRLSTPDEAQALQQRLKAQGPGKWILEQFLPFEKELSVLVVRAGDGTRRHYPVAENVHEAGILRTTRVPADIGRDVAERAAAMAGALVDAWDGVGVFCVELFAMQDGRLFVNEVAPRPHNSGHYTLDACPVSQFEQQVRAICGLPLGEVTLRSPAVMVNLLGEEFVKATTDPELQTFLRTAGATLHGYGKKSVRPGRKMGHVTFLADTPERAWKAALSFRDKLAQKSF